MKLSQMTTDQVADALLAIAPDIETLMGDNELAEIIGKRQTSSDKKEATKYGLVTIIRTSTHLLKRHREATWNILGALNQKSPDEVGRQPIAMTIKHVSEVLNDKDFLGFFTQSESSGQGEPSDISEMPAPCPPELQ